MTQRLVELRIGWSSKHFNDTQHSSMVRMKNSRSLSICNIDGYGDCCRRQKQRGRHGGSGRFPGDDDDGVTMYVLFKDGTFISFSWRHVYNRPTFNADKMMQFL